MPLQFLGLAVGAFSTGLDMWLGIGRVASQLNRYLHIYGGHGLLLPFIANREVFQLVEQVLWEPEEATAMRFVDSQLQQINMVAVVGSVTSGVATSGLSLKFLSSAHWTARAFILGSLLSASFCVYYSMRQLRILSALLTAGDVRNWLRAPPEKIRCKDKNRPSIRAVLILDTPRMLVAMAAVSYIVGLSVYLVCVFIMDLDSDAGLAGSRDTMIAYFVVLWTCLALYTKADIFDHYKNRRRVWLDIVMMLVMLKKLVWGSSECECEDNLPSYIGDCPGAVSPPLHLPEHRQIPHNDRREPSTGKGGEEKPPETPAHELHSTCSSRNSRIHRAWSKESTVLSLSDTVASHERRVQDNQRFSRALQAYRTDWGFSGHGEGSR